MSELPRLTVSRKDWITYPSIPFAVNHNKYANLTDHHHHHISFMELGHLLTRSGFTYPEVSSKVYHDSFCQLGSSLSLPWVLYFEAFYLHVVSSFSCIPVICPKLVLFLALCNLCICFVICPSVSCCSSHVFHLCCCYSSGVTCFNSPSFAALPYNKTARASVLYNFILVFLRVFCGLNTLFKIPVIFKKLFNLLSMSNNPS